MEDVILGNQLLIMMMLKKMLNGENLTEQENESIDQHFELGCKLLSERQRRGVALNKM